MAFCLQTSQDESVPLRGRAKGEHKSVKAEGKGRLKREMKKIR